MDETVNLRIVLTGAPVGVAYGLRGKDGAIIGRQISRGADLAFEFSLRVRRLGPSDPPRFLGEFAEGPTTARFVYLRLGTLAGQPESPWTRAIKVPLASIDWAQIEAAHGRRLEARVAGTDKRGAPACATVPLMGGGWRPVT